MENNLIYILTDYKGFFSGKQKSEYYRGGLDLERLSELLNQAGFLLKVLSYSDLSFSLDEIVEKKPFVLYQSTEDKEAFYKRYIEDVIFNLEENGVPVIPRFAYLQAHNNKVSMELLRKRSGIKEIQSIQTNVFGSLEELKACISDLKFPLVIKTASGSMSRGVELAEDPHSLLRYAKKIAASSSLRHDIKERLRKVKYRDKYIKESFHRSKFITQNLISGLDNDWKVLVYGDYIFTLYRGVKKNDFRASGSGDFIFDEELPTGMLEWAYQIQQQFDAPNVSLDVAFDGEHFHLIEFQFVNFGTTTIEKTPFYFKRTNNDWVLHREKVELEDIYIKALLKFLKKK